MARYRQRGCCSAPASLLLVVGLVALLAKHRCNAQGADVPNIISAWAPNYNIWVAIQHDLMRFLPTCNNPARQWWRAWFHDAGTFNAMDGSGGLDGSLQYELDREENDWAGPSIGVYRGIINQRTNWFFSPSMADMIVLGAKLALIRCYGPVTYFSPGRKDATVANKPGLLPGPKDTTAMLVTSAQRMGLTLQEFATLVAAGHTFADAEHHGLDSTPRKFDTVYQKELLAGTAPEILKSDANMLFNGEMRAAIERHNVNPAAFTHETSLIVEKVSSFGQVRNLLQPWLLSMVNTEATWLAIRTTDWTSYNFARLDQCFEPAGFGLIQGKDHNGDDFGQLPGATLQLGQACIGNPACQSFNTNGWWKFRSDINAAFAFADACEGLYIRRAPAVPPMANLGFTIGTGAAANVRKCLDVANGADFNGNPVQQWDCHGLSPQRFSVVDVGGGFYNLKFSSRCVDVINFGTDNAPLVLWDCSANQNQRFTFRPLPAPLGGFQIVPQHAQSYCITVPGPNTLANGQLRLQKCQVDIEEDDVVTQKFDWMINVPVVPPLNLPTEIRVGTADNMCLDVDAWQYTAGRQLQQWSCHGGTNQKFTFRDAGHGYVNIVAGTSNLCLDVEGISTTAGARIHLWPCGAQDNQKFKVKVNGAYSTGYNLALKHTGETQCADIVLASSITANGAKLIMWHCNNNPVQRFWWTSGTRGDSNSSDVQVIPPVPKPRNQSEIFMKKMLDQVLADPTPVAVESKGPVATDATDGSDGTQGLSPAKMALTVGGAVMGVAALAGIAAVVVARRRRAVSTVTPATDTSDDLKAPTKFMDAQHEMESATGTRFDGKN